jgi:hypothetical protein
MQCIMIVVLLPKVAFSISLSAVLRPSMVLPFRLPHLGSLYKCDCWHSKVDHESRVSVEMIAGA